MSTTAARVEADAVEVKGTPVLAMVSFINRRFTAMEKEHLVRSLPAEAASLLTRHVLPVETVRVTILNRITEAAAAAKGEPVMTFAHEAGRAAVDEAVQGIWKLAAALLSPRTLLAKGGRLWSTVYSHGRIEVAEPATQVAIVTLADFPSEAVGCARIGGWFERLFELARAKNIRVEQIECFSKGAAACKWKITWE